jgi:hypothetical protein
VIKKMKNPAARAGANRVRNSINLQAIDPDITAEGLVLQFLSHHYRIAPAVAATIAHLAGLGPKEARQ